MICKDRKTDVRDDPSVQAIAPHRAVQKLYRLKSYETSCKYFTDLQKFGHNSNNPLDSISVCETKYANGVLIQSYTIL